jgi:hypothetical protein
VVVDTDTSELVTEPAGVERRRRTKKPSRTMRWLVVTHRWSLLVLGIALVAITTSGAAVVYEPEWTKWHNASTFHSTPSEDPITEQQALAVVKAAHPKFDATHVISWGGIYDVGDADYGPQHYAVDPGTGNLNGAFTTDTGFMGVMLNLHECFLACEDYPGYVALLNHAFPVPDWLGEGGQITGGAIVLALAGLLLLLAAVSGFIIWFPTVKRWSQWARVRFGKGRYARDYDLHNVVGFVAVPFLLMWGFTGASFELPVFSNAWHAVTGTESVPDSAYEFASAKAPKGTPDISLTEAIAAGKARVGGTPRDVMLPDAKDPKGYFTLYFQVGVDGYAHSSAPGATAVYVDRHDASRLKVAEDPADRTVITRLWEGWRYGLFHYGFGVNAWWRLPWFLFGLTPLILMWTGVSTWLYTLGVKRRRKKARAARAEAAA